MANTASPETTLINQGDEICQSRRWRIVALSGVSGGGKTTMARFLLDTLPTTVVYLGQDEYIYPDNHSAHPKAPEIVGYINKDTILSIDMEKMLQDLEEIVSSDPATIEISNSSCLLERKGMIGQGLSHSRPPPCGRRQQSKFPAVLLLEGFLLYTHPAVPPLCDLRYFFTLNKLECWSRRNKRIFTSTTPMNTDLYFENCMWPSYIEHLTHVTKSVTGVHMLDGSTSQSVLQDRVLKDIINLLKCTE